MYLGKVDYQGKNVTEQTILLVGDKYTFSDLYIRTIKNEFLNSQVVTLPTSAQAKKWLSSETDIMPLVVISARVAEKEEKFLIEVMAMSDLLNFVVVFKAISEIKSLLAKINDIEAASQVNFLPLNKQIECAMTILRLLECGERYICGDVLKLMLTENIAISNGNSTHDFVGLHLLTAREVEVLVLVSQGKSNKLIANALKLSESTIKLHIHHIINKMGISNRTEATIIYLAYKKSNINSQALN